MMKYTFWVQMGRNTHKETIDFKDELDSLSEEESREILESTLADIRGTVVESGFWPTEEG